MPVLKIKNNGVWEQVGGIPDHTHVVDDITDFPTSLPANGGNADTVDGKHASDFASAAEMTTVQNNINDINTMLDGIEIPTTLPNPKAITFTGAAEGTYDGSSALTVEIPSVPEIPDISGKMDKNNPTGTGSFSLNRKAGTVIGDYSHAEGFSTAASGEASHAEGFGTTASGGESHAEGYRTTASESCSHAEGAGTIALGSSSHAEGNSTKASSSNQHVQGKYNIEDSSNVYADIIGNGTESKPSNAATVDWSGNAWYAGDVYVGSTSGTNKDEGSKKLATEEYVNNSVSIIEIPTALADLITDSTHRLVTDTEKSTWNAKAEVSAIPTKVSQLTNDSDFATNSDVTTGISTHNSSTEAHNDIRLLVQELMNKLNTLADSDDTTLDQLSEIVSYIKNNKSLIDGITTSKVSVTDIIDNLTTSATNKPLSAKQGVALKALIDAIVVPTKLPNPNAITFTGATEGTYDGSSALTVDIPSVPDIPTTLPNPQSITFTGAVNASYDGSSEMSVKIPGALSDLSEDAAHRVVTDAEKAKWNAKSNFSGSYNDLTDKPTIPDVPVQSVNGKTGAVVLSAEDVGALPGSTVIPEALPNPNALTFTGAVTGTYDGSNPLTVEIPVGADGKSAYQYAVEGGYTGTEAEFAEKLAQEMLSGTTDELTPTQVYDAVSAGIPVKVQYTDATFGTLTYTNFNITESANAIVANMSGYINGVFLLVELVGIKSENAWNLMFTSLANGDDFDNLALIVNEMQAAGYLTLDTLPKYEGVVE